MKHKLLNLLVCPECSGSFTQTVFLADGDELVDGLLTCPGGHIYPVVETIPRILRDAFSLFPEFSKRYASQFPSRWRVSHRAFPPVEAIKQTRDSFGYQWTLFSEMVIDFRENFLCYIRPLDESFFPGKVGIDVGCGFGRHIYNAALFGAEMVGVDISAAIDATRKNTRHLPNVHLVQADLYYLPFREGTFDFAYSIGVLHHLPDPEAGFRSLISLVRSGGAVFVWVYSKSRPVVNLLLESARLVTTRLPRGSQRVVSFLAAAADWVGFIVPYRIGSSLPVVGSFVNRIAFPRLKTYSPYPFQVVWADWFDRLAAPIRFYYDSGDLNRWLNRVELNRTVISATGLFGWRLYGERP